MSTAVAAHTLPEKPKRSLALDALRGYAILTMVLSGLVPNALPAWMYHAQTPPPTRAFDGTIPGITWVDLVFPFFLFSMGAAFPLALTRKLDSLKDKPISERFRIAFHVAERGVLLYFFAVFQQHTSMWGLGFESQFWNRALALVAFGILFLIFTRFPKEWPSLTGWILRLSGWAAAFGLLFWLKKYHDADLSRSNIILLVLANVVVSGTVLWILTRKHPSIRMGILILLLGIWLLKGQQGWMREFWNYVPAIPWGDDPISLSFLYSMNFHKYLFIVIPGTFAGELLLNRFANEPDTADSPTWSAERLAGISTVSLAVIVASVVGLFMRELAATIAILIVLCAFSYLLLMKPKHADEKRLRLFFAWGVFFLFLGLCFEPYEGGIKKDSATTSYFFVTTGQAFFALIFLTVIIDMLNYRKAASLLVLPGQNPMIAYVGGAHLIGPILGLTGIEYGSQWLLGKCGASFPVLGPWAGFGYALLKTLLLAFVVSIFTKKKIFWRT